MKNQNYLRQSLFQFEFDRLYLFLNYFGSEGNATASQMAKRFCEENDDGERSLFLCGQTGCGKTHLLQAIGNELAEKDPNAVIRFFPLKQVRENLKQASDEEDDLVSLINRYEQADALLIDDVEELSDLPQAQEALFHLYNKLREGGKRFVATGKNPPTEIKALSPHLTTRLAWGGLIAIPPPDDGVRRKILENLASEKKLVLEAKEIDFILNHFPRDYPSLAGIVEKVNSYSLLKKRRATIPLIKEACGSML